MLPLDLFLVSPHKTCSVNSLSCVYVCAREGKPRPNTPHPYTYTQNEKTTGMPSFENWTVCITDLSPDTQVFDSHTPIQQLPASRHTCTHIKLELLPKKCSIPVHVQKYQVRLIRNCTKYTYSSSYSYSASLSSASSAT